MWYNFAKQTNKVVESTYIPDVCMMVADVLCEQVCRGGCPEEEVSSDAGSAMLWFAWPEGPAVSASLTAPGK